MATLRILATGHKLKYLSSPEIPSGSYNFDKVQYVFDGDWNGYEKYAVFKTPTNTKYFVELDDENSCYVPNEVLVTPQTISVGVYGLKGTESRISSTLLDLKIPDGAYRRTQGDKAQLIVNIGHAVNGQDIYIAASEDNLDNTIEKITASISGFDEKINNVKDIVSGYDRIIDENNSSINMINESLYEVKTVYDVASMFSIPPHNGEIVRTRITNIRGMDVWSEDEQQFLIAITYEIESEEKGTLYEIPDEVMDLPGYGLGIIVGPRYTGNYIQYEDGRWKYHEVVGSVTLDESQEIGFKDGIAFVRLPNSIYDFASYTGNTNRYSIECSHGYEYNIVDTPTSISDNTFNINSDMVSEHTCIYIDGKKYTSPTTLKNALKNKPLTIHYMRKTPIVTDITSIMDWNGVIDVSSEDIIRFHQYRNYQLEIPYQVEYTYNKLFDLDKIREGAAAGATALQPTPWRLVGSISKSALSTNVDLSGCKEFCIKYSTEVKSSSSSSASISLYMYIGGAAISLCSIGISTAKRYGIIAYEDGCFGLYPVISRYSTTSTTEYNSTTSVNLYVDRKTADITSFEVKPASSSAMVVSCDIQIYAK